MPKRPPALRTMQEYDVDAVVALEKQCFAQPWRRQSFLYDLRHNACARYLVAEENDVIVGYAGMWLSLGSAHIVTLAVAPQKRRRGVAKTLLRALVALAWELLEISHFTLEVRVSNHNALRLYEQIGFRVNTVQTAYYEDGEDAFVMELEDATAFRKGRIW